jgi:hypothetical protein
MMKDWPDKGTELLACGQFRREQVTAELEREPFDPGPELAALIAAEWITRLREAEEKGSELFDGPLVRLVSWSKKRGRLRLRLQPTTYREYIGTNLRAPSLPPEKRADPLGNSALVRTADGKIVLGRRSGKVFRYAGRIHCIGGHIEPQNNVEGGRLDTFAAIIDEVTEELNVEREQVADVVCCGLVRDAVNRQPEQLFTVQVDVRAAELRPQGPEHTELISLVDTPVEINKFLADCGEMIAPVARACLYAHMERLKKRM